MSTITTKDGTVWCCMAMTTRSCRIGASAMLSSKLIKGATLKVYPGAPHGLPTTHKDQVNTDLLAFLKA